MLDLQHISKTFNPGTVNEKVALQRVDLHLEAGAGVPSECLKLISAVIVALAIAAPALQARAAFKRRRAHAEKEGASRA